MNLGLQHASGEYVWVFDDDDIAYPEKLERHIALFEQDTEVGFTHSAYHLFQEEEPEQGDREVAVQNCPDEELLRRLLLTRNFMCGVSVVARKACYDKVGGFDEQLVRSQDYDMWIRFARYFRAKGVPEPTLKVREHKGERGSAADRFDAEEMGAKQHQYHRIVFKKVYDEIPLEEIFGAFRDPQKRFEALVERVWMVIKRLLVEEAKADLREIEQLLEAHPEVEILPVFFRCFAFLEQVAMKKGYREMADLVRRILALRGLQITGPAEAGMVWDRVTVVFGETKTQRG